MNKVSQQAKPNFSNQKDPNIGHLQTALNLLAQYIATINNRMKLDPHLREVLQEITWSDANTFLGNNRLNVDSIDGPKTRNFVSYVQMLSFGSAKLKDSSASILKQASTDLHNTYIAYKNGNMAGAVSAINEANKKIYSYLQAMSMVQPTQQTAKRSRINYISILKLANMFEQQISLLS